MDPNTLNEILSFINADFVANEKLPVSGQREVFSGIQTGTSFPCVIKHSIITPISVGRIQREIRVLGELDSEYFPKIFYQTFITDSIILDFYDSFDTRNEAQNDRLSEIRKMNIRPFLLTAEEYIEHKTWEECIGELKKEINLVTFLIHVFKAMALLWGAQVAHRDLKPENILLRSDLRPVIIDLGIAKSFRPGTLQLTLVGNPCTPRYAAPEQLTNTRNEITYKTDQFAIGVIAFLVLTGQFPYGDFCKIEGQIIDNFKSGNITNIRDYNDSINEELLLFIEKLLQVHPYKRFRNVDTILQQLEYIRGLIS